MVQYAANGLGATIVPRAFTGQRSDGPDPVRTFHILELTGSALSLTIGVFKKAVRDSPSTGAFLAMLLAGKPSRSASSRLTSGTKLWRQLTGRPVLGVVGLCVKVVRTVRCPGAPGRGSSAGVSRHGGWSRGKGRFVDQSPCPRSLASTELGHSQASVRVATGLSARSPTRVYRQAGRRASATPLR